MANNETLPVVLSREEVESIIDELTTTTERVARRKALDAQVLGKLHTFYGHRRSDVPRDLVPAAFRRVRDLLRGA